MPVLTRDAAYGHALILALGRSALLALGEFGESLRERALVLQVKDDDAARPIVRRARRQLRGAELRSERAENFSAQVNAGLLVELRERVRRTLLARLLGQLARERDHLLEGLRRVRDRGVEGRDGIIRHEREKRPLRRRVRGDRREHALPVRRADRGALRHASVLERARERDRLHARSAHAVEELAEGLDASPIRTARRVVNEARERRAVEEAEHAV